METEWSCPICGDDQEDVAYMSPCLHQFCLGCALRWARQKPNCPLCRSVTTTILFSVRSDDDYLMFDVPGPTEPPAEDRQEEHEAVGPVPRPEVGGFTPEVWADFFKSHPDNIRPLLPWLQQEFRVVFEDRRWEVAAAEGTVVVHLCLYGLDEEALLRHLQGYLTEYTGTFVHRLIPAAVHLCGREIRRHLGQQQPQAVGEENDSPAASSSSTSSSPTSSRGGTPDPRPASSSSPASSDGEEEAGTSQAALRGDCSRPPSAPAPAEQEQPQEQPREVVAAAGPSARGCRCSPSAPGWSGDRSPKGHRHAPKRRAPSPQDSPQPCKRPPRRQH
ncbi:hypothetical protein GRJ2_003033900 [Grus japonensis]|uniref:RING-type E3 ubiquitin transferase n=1 Tax=Grus japonensis TaxID=30415 RepID=A0ABC9Y6J7_GRUJA